METITYLITGGSGFLGRHLIEKLLMENYNSPMSTPINSSLIPIIDSNNINNNNELKAIIKIIVYDLVQSFDHDNVTFIIGSINDKESLTRACINVDIVIHIAALTDPYANYKEYYLVNVIGSQNVVDACLSTDVAHLIFTSSSSVVLDGSNIKGGDETMSFPSYHLDYYSKTKAIAEQYIRLSDKKKTYNGKLLRTVCLRPAAMFGPRDERFIARLLTKARNGEVTHMIGNGENIVDFTYVDNVVHAIILASHSIRNFTKNCSNNLTNSSLTVSNSAPICIGGKVYFITNGEPRLFWDFIRYILSESGCVGPDKYVSTSVAYAFAWLFETFSWILRYLRIDWMVGKPRITRAMVANMASHHWYSHAAATKDFGYMPIVSLQEGCNKTVAFYSNWDVVVKREFDDD